MVKYKLEVCGEAENIKELFPDPDPATRWYIRLKCTSCGEVQGQTQTDHWVYLNQEEFSTQNGQKANFVNKCKTCKREMTISIVPKTLGSCVFEEEKPNDYQAVVQFEARGAELLEYDFRAGWNAKALNSRQEFTGLEFSPPDCDWVDYDSTANEPVGLFQLKSRFVKTH